MFGSMRYLVVIAALLAGAGCGAETPGGHAGHGGSGGAGGSGGSGGGQEPVPEICGDRIDNDLDGADDFADSDCAVGPVLAAGLQGKLDEARGSEVGALALGIETTDDRVATLASGTVAVDGRALLPGDRFPIGSITKSFVAVLVLQLRDEGKLALDDTLSTWLPDFPRADRITLHHLLSHTSGIAEYLQANTLNKWLLARTVVTPAQMVELAAEQAPLFEPGTRWAYSNSNYVLLGLVIEAVTGTPVETELRARIFEPLGMADSFLQGEEEGSLEVHGYVPQTVGELDMIPYWNGTPAWTAGAIVSTTADMLRFSHGLFQGELLTDTSLGEMITPVGDAGSFRYGYGIIIGDGWIGHDGAVPGWMAQWIVTDEGNTIVTLQNRFDDADALARATSGAIDQL